MQPLSGTAPVRFFPRASLNQLLLSLASVGGPAAAAVAAYFLHLNLSTTGSLEILLVVIVALRWGFFQATLTSLTGVACLNYLFTAPLFQFTVADPKNLISLVTFEATALLVSRLSSKVRIHAAEVELERKRNAKLYELSRAILLIDVRRSTSHQVSELIRELIEVDRVEILSLYEASESRMDQQDSGGRSSPYETHLAGLDLDQIALRRTRRRLRIGTTIIGSLDLQGWESDPLLADAIASLVAIALERARAIREENRAEAERNTEQLRTAVLDGLAHGYKTPLTAIQTASSGLLAIRKMTPTQTELVSIIDDQATVLSQLTTRLLKTAALEVKEVRLRRIHVQVPMLLRDVVETQDESVQARIHLEFAEGLRSIRVDEDLMKLALEQLLDNAAKYSDVGRDIEVGVVQDETETVISISNEGSPIPVAEREKIFQRFYRGLESARGPTGTGLGLSIVRKTAEAHSGRAWVDCEHGRNRFSLAIPEYKGDTR